jgi:hypothetical protein
MPFPLLDLQRKLLACRVFGKADLKKAYWLILLAGSSRKHVAVRVDDRIYYPTRLPQGLKVSPQICQRVLTAVLRGANDEEDLTLLKVGRLLLYIDDLLLAAESEDELAELWRRVLKRFEDYCVRLNQDKCTYMAEQVTFAGRVVTAAGILPQYGEAEGLDSKVPGSEHEVADLVYGWDFFRVFIPDFGRIMAPARELLTSFHRKYGSALRKFFKKRRTWTADEQTRLLEGVVDKLRESAKSQMALAFPDGSKQFFIFTDASNEGWSGIVGQVDRIDEKAEVALGERNPQLLRCYSGVSFYFSLSLSLSLSAREERRERERRGDM